MKVRFTTLALLAAFGLAVPSGAAHAEEPTQVGQVAYVCEFVVYNDGVGTSEYRMVQKRAVHATIFGQPILTWDTIRGAPRGPLCNASDKGRVFIKRGQAYYRPGATQPSYAPGGAPVQQQSNWCRFMTRC